MTIPLNNWCNACQETCHDHATICTVCGTTLGIPPASLSSSRGNASGTNATTATATTTARTVLGDEILDDMRQASQDLREILGSLQGQVRNLDSLTRSIMEQQQQLQQRQQQEWQTIPAHVLDPTNVVASALKSRPTSKTFLANKIPRIVLTPQCTLLRQATLEVSMLSTGVTENKATKTTTTLSCVLGEFGPTREYRLEGMSLVICSPITGKGGLSVETKAQISDLWRQQQQRRPINNNGSDYVVAFMLRGDDLTFVQKALLAQRAGASAVVIGNTTSSPWPYVMKDFKGEAEEHGLVIPVAMVKEADAKLILEQYQQQLQELLSQQSQSMTTAPRSMNCSLQCNFHITDQARDCAVCCEGLETSERVVQIPGCGHVFHEGCAMTWLESHNTCPSCRLELPTDDVEYERERGRQQRTHAGGSEAGRVSEWNEFYG